MGFFSNLFGKKNDDEIMRMEANELEAKSEVADLASNSGSFRFQIEDIFTITGRGTIVTGRALSGTANVNDIVYVNGMQTTITGIEMFRKSLDSVNAGDNAGLLLSGISREMIKKGDIITK